MQKKFPVSASSFEQLVEKKHGQYIYHFVDKSGFIKEILDNSGRVLLLTRPRRFGKSTNLDMLKCFLDIRMKEKNQSLFDGLKIQKMHLTNGEPSMDHGGRYPVITLNFKTLRGKTYQELWDMFKNLVRELYVEHDDLLKTTHIKDVEKVIFEKIMNKTADDADYKTALKSLINYRKRQYDKRVFVLIDEYDVPFQQALHQQQLYQDDSKESYFENLKNLMGTFLGSALKDNPDLDTCVMTGIVRIAGAGVFSELNNIDTWTVLDERFSEYFGFTQEELNDLLHQTGQFEKAKEFSHWYNGYEFGGRIIYNPFSVMKCLDRQCEFSNYWLNTSDNQLIKDSLLFPHHEQHRQEINEAVAVWVSGGNIEKTFSKDLTFNTSLTTLEHLWILLISAGYLKVTDKQIMQNDQVTCQLEIPNQEVMSIYRKIFKEWLNTLGIQENSSLIQLLLTGEAEAFCLALKQFFKEILSYRDTSHKPVALPNDEKYEAYYHGFMVGILGLSMNHYQASLKSNRESGYGYYDLVLEPKLQAQPPYDQGIIFEFKRAGDKEAPESAAVMALKQIKDKQYQTEMVQRGVKSFVLMGIAFQKKHLAASYEVIKIEHGELKVIKAGKISSHHETIEKFTRPLSTPPLLNLVTHPTLIEVTTGTQPLRPLVSSTSTVSAFSQKTVNMKMDVLNKDQSSLMQLFPTQPDSVALPQEKKQDAEKKANLSSSIEKASKPLFPIFSTKKNENNVSSAEAEVSLILGPLQEKKGQKRPLNKDLNADNVVQDPYTKKQKK